MKSILKFILAAWLCLPFQLNASEETDKARGDSGLEPEITIIDEKGARIEEYRSHGRTYMIKVTPKKGRPYFLVDGDGDGEFEVRRNELDPNLLIPSWVIFSW